MSGSDDLSDEEAVSSAQLPGFLYTRGPSPRAHAFQGIVVDALLSLPQQQQLQYIRTRSVDQSTLANHNRGCIYR